MEIKLPSECEYVCNTDKPITMSLSGEGYNKTRKARWAPFKKALEAIKNKIKNENNEFTK